jgi:hypothetical protein
MSEEKPLFKFKKAPVTVGGFDINDNTEWAFMIKQEFGDLPSFVHIRKMWNIQEIPDTIDPSSGEIIRHGVPQVPVVVVHKGFVKDGNFILTVNPYYYNKTTFHEAKQVFKKVIESYLVVGFVKDEVTVGEPTYYLNERTPMVDQNALLSSTTSTSQSQQTIASQALPSGVPSIKAKNPILRILGRK